MYKRKRAGNTITRKINSTKDTAAKADKNHYISNSYLEGFIPIDTEYFTASFRMNFANIEGFLRNAGYRILGLGEKLLFFHASLLDTIRQTHQDWLERILRIIYNSGGFLPAVP